MNTILRIISTGVGVETAARLLCKNRVDDGKLRRMALGECMFSRNNATLKEAALLALAKGKCAAKKRKRLEDERQCELAEADVLRRARESKRRQREIKKLQNALAVDGGVCLAG